MKRRFAMLDRDGTLIYERHYLADPEQVELLPGVVEGLRALRSMGLGLVVLTNQSGVGRGFFDLATLGKIHERMRWLLKDQGIELDGIYYCPHSPEDGCTCRKPAAGMVARAVQDLDFDPAQGFMIGDKNADVQLGNYVGAKTVLVLTGYGQRELESGVTRPDHIVANLADLPPIVAEYVKAAPASDGGIVPKVNPSGPSLKQDH